MGKVSVVSGNIAEVKANALITAVNSGGWWLGGIDGVIRNYAGDLFHRQLAAAIPQKQGETFVAKSNGQMHDGAFQNVVFVVDDLYGALRDVVYSGLAAASEAGFSSVTLPMIRTGVMLGVVEKSVEEAVSEMKKGVERYLEENPKTSLDSIIFVVYNQPEMAKLLKRAFGLPV